MFADVVGQPQVTETLKNELRSGHIAHAYLFTGSRGTGKTTCAKILSKAVNCLASARRRPLWGLRNLPRAGRTALFSMWWKSMPPVITGWITSAALREEANFTPAQARYRVYIIDEVHMLSPGAFNALLKTLEEPPAHVIFILATTEVHKLPATILSRCQRFDFHRIAVEDDRGQRLQYVAEQEGASITGGMRLCLLPVLADGGMRDAAVAAGSVFWPRPVRWTLRNWWNRPPGLPGTMTTCLTYCGAHLFGSRMPSRYLELSGHPVPWVRKTWCRLVRRTD